MQKKILISAPRFYGIDEAIQESRVHCGFNAILKIYRTESTLQGKIDRRLTIKIPLAKPIFMPPLRHYLSKELQHKFKILSCPSDNKRYER
ncbi:MAG: hypothetical protein NTX75_09425 [Proteobacteria bacterium]|nr:hypothetical protein [Pseudomonadota bacterium]